MGSNDYLELWKQIAKNRELQDLEIEGFLRGQKKDKTMDVGLNVIIDSLTKQFLDLQMEINGQRRISELKRCIADLRNVAGCLFLKLDEMEQEIMKIRGEV